jgi:hypothetical protein
VGIAERLVMTAFWSYLIDLTSRALDEDERDAVLGDLTEFPSQGITALGQVCGLVVRRQTGLWVTWQPWAALLGIVIPLGLFLSLMCRFWAEGTAIDAFIYVHNGSWIYLTYPGWREDVLRTMLEAAIKYSVLAYWSWTAGYVIGSLSQRATAANTVVLILLLSCEFVAVPQPHNTFSTVVFATWLYEVGWPVAARAAFVALPATIGARAGRRATTLPLTRATMLALVAVALTGLRSRSIQQAAVMGWWRFEGFIYGGGYVYGGWQVHLLPLLAMWPALYVFIRSATGQWLRRRV